MHNHPSFKIRFAHIEDIDDIVDIFTKNYGEHYIYDAYLNPAMLIEDFNSQKLVTIVAEYKKKIIGHIALVPFNNKYEIGRFLVSPGYKDLGVGKAIYEKLRNYIEKKKLYNIFTECVTTNGRSSNIAFKNGLRSIGFGLGLCKNFYQDSPPRETMQYLVLPSVNIKESYLVYSHPVLVDVSNMIYQYHKFKRKNSLNIITPQEENTKYTVSYDDRNRRIGISIDIIGKDLKKVLSNFCTVCTNQGYAIINCEIDMKISSTSYAIEELSEVGFLFSFLWPNYIQNNHHTDLLCMQYITPNNEFSLDGLDIPNMFAKHLLERMKPDFLHRKSQRKPNKSQENLTNFLQT